MNIQNRPYKISDDFDNISNFLIENYLENNKDGNWLQPAWEYMHSHPCLDRTSLEKIRIWENDNKKILGVVHYESTLGEAFFQIHKDFNFLKTEMLDYAEKNLYGISKQNTKYLRVYINDFDNSIIKEIKNRNYKRDKSYDRSLSQYIIPSSFPEININPKFKLQSLQDDNDYAKIHKVLWRGFNHSGEPDKEGIKDRITMQSVPSFRKDLNIVAVNEEGYFVSYAGMWFDKINKYAYVEPVATDPDYRKLGIGKCTVLEGIRRCAGYGAKIVFVGSNLIFYQKIGFKKIINLECWIKEL